VNNPQEYDAWHEQLAGHEFLTEDLHHPWHVTVARLLPDLQGRTVLEIGCGRGDFAIWLAIRFPKAHVTAIDFSNAAIEIAKSRARDAAVSVGFAVESAEYLSFRDRSFDYVVSCECMEHVAYPLHMAKEIHRVLRLGGHFILTTPNYFNGMILAWLQSWVLGKPFDSGSNVQPRENFLYSGKLKASCKEAASMWTRWKAINFSGCSFLEPIRESFALKTLPILF